MKPPVLLPVWAKAGTAKRSNMVAAATTRH
jgi:hypothetical protein